MFSIRHDADSGANEEPGKACINRTKTSDTAHPRKIFAPVKYRIRAQLKRREMLP